MDARQNFWLALHQLSESIERQGPTPVDRTDAILDFLNELSSRGREDALAELTAVLVELEVIHSLAKEQVKHRQFTEAR
jgi:hypothetical protein